MPIGVAGEVGHNENNSLASSIIVTLGAGIAAGHLAVGGVANATPAGSVSSVTDSKGNTWTVRSTAVGGNARGTIIECIVGVALVAGDTVTVNFSGNVGSQFVSIADASGQAVSPHDQGGTNTGTGTTAFTVASGSTAQADEIAFVCYGYGSTSGTPFANNGGYTAIGDRFGTNRGIWFGYRVLTTTGVETAAQTCGASNSFAAAIDTYKAAAVSASVRAAATSARRARTALAARRKHRQAARSRGRSVTTATPLVRTRVRTRPDRRRQLLARRRHHNAIYVRPRIVAAPKFVRPAITVIERKRQALMARRRHKANSYTKSKLGTNRPQVPRVVRRPRTALAARRRHHGQQFISSRVAPYVRPRITVVSRKQRPRHVARRKHHQPVVTRSRTFPPLVFVKQHILVVKRNLGARLARRKHQVHQVFRSLGGVPKDRWLTPDPSTSLEFDPATTGTLDMSAASTDSLTFSPATDGTLAVDSANDGDITFDPSKNSEH